MPFEFFTLINYKQAIIFTPPQYFRHNFYFQIKILTFTPFAFFEQDVPPNW